MNNDGKPPSAMMNAASNTKPPMGPNNANASRPPLPPGRPGSAASTAAAAAFNKSNGQNPSRASSTPNSTTTTATTATGDDKRLTVFLRVRPPVCANGKKGNEGSINTVEVIKPAAAVVGGGGGAVAGGGLPTTIRTYPPLDSNAAKVVRGSNTRASARRRVNTNQSSNTSKSFNDDENSTSSSSGVDPTAEIRGVKEYSYSGVFAPESTQSDVYTNVAAPLVEGLFPQAANNNNDIGDVYGELGESALLFTLGVTNAGKTHTVMGNTGLEPMKQKMTRQQQQQQQQKGTKAKKLTMKKMMPKSAVKLGDDFKLNQDCGIIPRSLDHMLAKIKTLNDQATQNGQQCLQLYMSYLEIYNENIYDLLPNPSEEDNKPRRPCDSQPTLKLRESRRGKIFVRGLARHAVDNVQQGLELAHMAKMNRHTASNNINEESSRSHSICQLEIAYAPATRSGNAAAAAAAASGLKKSSGGNDTDVDSEFESDDESVCSKSSIGSSNSRLSNTTRQQQRKKSTIIWIVDLAGSERGKKTRAHTRHQKEAALINASLMNLMRCLREMLNHQPTKKRGGGSSKGGVVPFRDSKLSHMFMNHLTGPSASRTSMVVNVNPAADDYDETQHVLAYAATARSVTISAVDYNRSLRRFAKESKAKKTNTASGTSTAKQALANIAKKLSPKKRKGGAATESKNPAAKRLRSNSHTSSASAASSLGSTKRFGNSATSSAARKPPPKFGGRSTQSGTTKGSTQELEQLREENFELKFTVDDLRQQLDDCETTTRNEVVEQMDEQLQDAKIWYENRIAKLQQEVNLRQSSSKQDGEQEGVAVGLSSSEAEEMQEQIAECEEEMKRMRDDHEEEVQKLSSEHLALVREHQVEIDNLKKEHKKQLAAEQSKAKHLENEVGMLRHQSTELQVSHASLLEKYNALLAVQKEQATANTASAQQEKENPSVAAAAGESPSFRKLPRERVSDVASAAGCVDIVSPSKKKRGWFVKSPAKVAIGAEKKPPTRSPLGKINKK